ncbi:MAG: tetratricopeptide repeat protein [Deltaproteobacteria bacterium]|nr:tetratricopeptide repeat protein [Deltaproteobacteria bacterium]
MYTKILLVVIIFILSAFFYLHTQNPGSVTFVVTQGHTYVLPVTLLVFFAFFAGAVFAVLNSLLVDARRAIMEMKGRREKKLLAQAEENYRKGTEALFKGDTGEARALMEKALTAKPNDTNMIISLCETLMRDNRPKEALKALDNGLSNSPDSIGLLIAIARCSSDSGDSRRAAGAYSEVLKLDPKNPYALRKLRDFNINDGQWSEAAALQKTVVECEKDDAVRKKEKGLLTGLIFEAASRSLQEGRLGEAVGMVKEILKNDSSFMPAHMLLGEALARNGNTSNAIKVWEKARHKYPNSEPILLKLEDSHRKESAPEKILERYKKEIISNPDDAKLRLLLSRLYLRLEMVDNAIEELERLFHEGEDGFYTQILLGEAYLRRKQSGKAAHLFHKALDLDREFLPPFICSNCSATHKAWNPRCPSCGMWNTLTMHTAPAAPRAGSTPFGIQKIAAVRQV